MSKKENNSTPSNRSSMGDGFSTPQHGGGMSRGDGFSSQKQERNSSFNDDFHASQNESIGTKTFNPQQPQPIYQNPTQPTAGMSGQDIAQMAFNKKMSTPVGQQQTMIEPEQGQTIQSGFDVKAAIFEQGSSKGGNQSSNYSDLVKLSISERMDRTFNGSPSNEPSPSISGSSNGSQQLSRGTENAQIAPSSMGKGSTQIGIGGGSKPSGPSGITTGAVPPPPINGMNTVSIAYGGRRGNAGLSYSANVSSDEILNGYLPQGETIHRNFVADEAKSIEAINRRSYEVNCLQNEIKQIKEENIKAVQNDPNNVKPIDWKGNSPEAQKVQMKEQKIKNLEDLNKKAMFQNNAPLFGKGAENNQVSREFFGNNHKTHSKTPGYLQLKAKAIGKHMRYTAPDAAGKTLKGAMMAASRAMYSTGSETDKGNSLIINSGMLAYGIVTSKMNKFSAQRYAKMEKESLSKMAKMKDVYGNYAHVNVISIKESLMQLNIHNIMDVSGIVDVDSAVKYAKLLLQKDADGEISLTSAQRKLLKSVSESLGITAKERGKAIDQALKSKYNIVFSQMAGANGMHQLNVEWKAIKAAYARRGEKVPTDLVLLFKERKKQLFAQSVQQRANKKGNMALTQRLKHTFLLKPLQQNGEAGQGAVQLYELGHATIRTVKTGVAAIWKGTSIVAQEIAQLASLLVQLTAFLGRKVAAGATLVGANAIAGSIHATGAMFRGVHKGVTGVTSKVGDMASKVGDAFNRFKDKINIKKRLKNAIKDKLSQLWASLLKKSKLCRMIDAIGQKFFKPIGNALAKIYEFLKAILDAILRPFKAFAAACLACFAIMVIIMSGGGSAIMSAFSLSSQTYDTKEMVKTQLSLLLEDDFTTIFDRIDEHISYTKGKIYLTYSDKKDFEKYGDALSTEESENFTQSSNCGEILSMALIKYNYDFGIVKDRFLGFDKAHKSARYKEVEKYINGMWFGSHTTYLTETVRQELVSSTPRVDANNNPVLDEETQEQIVDYVFETYSDVTINYETVYFNSLFDCKESTSRKIVWVTPDSSIISSASASWEKVYYTLRQSGFNHQASCAIMGNLAMEVGNGTVTRDGSINLYVDGAIDTDNLTHRGICQWSPTRWADLLSYCGSGGDANFATIEGQIAFMKSELENHYSGVYNYLNDTSNSISDMAYKFASEYEVCAEQYRDPRRDIAIQADTVFGSNQNNWYSELNNKGYRLSNEAKKYIGTSWKYLGNSLTDGCDAVHLVSLCLKNCGYENSMTTMESWNISPIGTRISTYTNIENGDVIVYGNSYVGIYCGNDEIITSAFSHGVYKTSAINNDITGIYRILD